MSSGERTKVRSEAELVAVLLGSGEDEHAGAVAARAMKGDEACAIDGEQR